MNTFSFCQVFFSSDIFPCFIPRIILTQNTNYHISLYAWRGANIADSRWTFYGNCCTDYRFKIWIFLRTGKWLPGGLYDRENRYRFI